VSARRLPPARRLRPHERSRLAAEIVISFARVRRELRRRPIDDAVAALRHERADMLHGKAAKAVDRTDALLEARRLGDAVMRTLSLLPGDTRCLMRSLVLTRLLARREITATLVIGARAAPDFLAHAWVEHRGMPVLPPGEDSFGRLVEL
jgi:Transglutaminase-like superfamily